MTGPGGVSGSGRVVDQPGGVAPLDGAYAPRHFVPVTTWVHPDVLVAAQPYRVAGRSGRWRRSWCLLIGGVVVGVAVVATLVVCVVIALLALVAWVIAHAVAVGVGIAAVVVTALVFLLALTRARNAPICGGCCEWGDHRA